MPIQKNVLSVSVKKGLLHFLTVVAALAVAGTGLTLTSPASANSATSSADTPTATCVGVNPMGAATPIGSESGYTVFVKGDATIANSELEGSLAVGGTATFGVKNGNSQYAIMHSVAGNADYEVPTVEGEPNRVLIQNFGSGSTTVVQVKNDKDHATAGVKIGDSSTPQNYTFGKSFDSDGTTFFPSKGNNQSPQIESWAQPWTNLAAAQKSWGITGDVLSHFPDDTGTSVLQSYDGWQQTEAPRGNDQTITLSSEGPSKLSLSDFAGISKFKLANYSETSFLVITVSAADVKNGTVTLPPYSFEGDDPTNGDGVSHILFDFSEIEGEVNVVSSGEPVRGSIYAPNAKITFPANGQQFEGQIIAKDFAALQNGQEIHTNLFKGRFPCTTQPTENKGTFNLRKVLDGVTAEDFPDGTTFPVTATWTIDGKETSREYNLPADGSVVESGESLPEGTVVSFAEGDLPAAPQGYLFESADFSPQTVTIGVDETAEVTVTNTYTREKSALPVTGGGGIAAAVVASSVLLLLGGGAALLLILYKRHCASF
jgi:choice-of-anchor A domain-containing protein